MKRERKEAMHEQAMTRRAFLTTSGLVVLAVATGLSVTGARGESFRAVARGRVDLGPRRRPEKRHA